MMILITVTIFFTCYFFVSVSGLVTCGTGIWADTTCVELTKCPEVLQRLKQLHQSNKKEHAHFLTNHVQPAHCDFNRDRPKICCPIVKPISTESKDTGKTAYTCGDMFWKKNTRKNGMPAELGEFPWLALLEYETKNGIKFGCGGALISDRHVLTAAHCLDPYESKLIRVRLGEHDLQTARDCNNDLFSPECSRTAIDVGIEKQMPHESYSSFYGPRDFDSLSYDIAVLKLNRSVISDVIKPICLPDQLPIQPSGTKNRPDNVIEKFILAGWGILEDSFNPKSSVKLMSRLINVNKNDCDNKYSYTLKDDFICALSKSPANACLADSGGPLMGINSHLKMSVMGIYSPIGNLSCREKGVPSTFVDVRRYVDWIRLQM